MSRTLIAGSRGFVDEDYVEAILHRIYRSDILDGISEVIEGGARGVDTIARWWAQGMGIKVTTIRANWKLHGKRAGYLRNATMVQEADQAIVVWDGKSPGTRHTIDLLLTTGTPSVIVVAPS